ncbi:helix-turn-helix domain-containing protein [Streptomyces sp. 1331.2]|uniref:helix-turn-helix domain-containing protein n=1 Tax=Streptomyces sp. 1331.2 TaxID=1938835 RepID=UPI000BC9550B|nr:helix-turn-helix transcriptional regulator [Streptomyces sp. 1331.2]SOB83342.1 Helix-turn-helix domain-containing protein [Streptomyces sp. 1331.2]
MPLRREPTLRQRRLGAEMRRMREQAGLGGSQLARELGLAPTQVTQMETGKIGVSAERLRTVAAACSCSNAPLIEALAEMATERRKGWWEEYRGTVSTDLLDLAELEDASRQLTTYTITFVHGLLQTRAYAASVFARAIPPLPDHEVDVRLNFRMQRQHIVHPNTTPIRAFIHEAALRMQFSGPKVLADQLDVLIKHSEQPGISIRAVPFDVESLPGPSENFTYAEGPVAELDTLQIDTSHNSLIFDSPAQLASYREILRRMASVALSEEESRDFIRRIKKEIESKHG